MYKNYVFDLYGTLIDIETDEDMAQLWDKIAVMYRYKGAQYSGKELKADYIKFVDEEKAKVRKKHPEFTHIEIKLENVFKKLFTQKGVKVNKAYLQTIATSFRAFSTTKIQLFDNVISTLKALKEKGKRVYLLSNAQRIFTENELDMFGLTQCFDGIFISSDCLCSKPDAHYYDALINEYGLDKAETIMVGNDAVSDIQGAKNAGINALYIPEMTSYWKAQYKMGQSLADHSIMDGDFKKILELTVK